MKRYDNNSAPICIAEEFWANSQLSVARYYGGCRCFGHEYIIVNSRGMDLWECTAEANKLGREKAIPAGESADLVRQDFVRYYRKLGRDRFLGVLKENNGANDKVLTSIFKGLMVSHKKEKTELNLFNDEVEKVQESVQQED